MNTASYLCTRRATSVECVGVGDFIFDHDQRHLFIVLPHANGKFGVDVRGRSVLEAIRISRTPTNEDRVWHWDGNENHPTLTPSVHVVGHWHGYLTNGELKSC